MVKPRRFKMRLISMVLNFSPRTRCTSRRSSSTGARSSLRAITSITSPMSVPPPDARMSETVHTRRGPERLEGADPVGRDIDRRVWGLGFVLAGETAHQFAGGVEDFQGDGGGWGGLQVVIDDGAIGWVLSAGLFGGQRRIGIGIARIAPGRAGREEVRGRGGGLGGQLAERGDIVENPEAAAVRAHHEIAVVHDEIAHRGGGHVEAQGLPIVAIVEADENGKLGGGEEQALADRSE